MTLLENIALAWRLLPGALGGTLYMVLLSTIFAALIGYPLGILLWSSGPLGLRPKRQFYRFLSLLVNIGRSIPFAILIVAIFPLTRLIVGTSLGTTASIVPLTLAAAPFVARLVEGALSGVDRGIIDAAVVMGSSGRQVVTKILLPETAVAQVRAITLTMINLISYSAMAGLVGGGGLGKIAIQYGYQRFNGFLLWTTLVLLLILVQIVEWIGERLARNITFQRGLE